MGNIFTTHHQIADWFELVYHNGTPVRVSTFNYYLDITPEKDYAKPYRKNGSRRIIDMVYREDLQLMVGVPHEPPPALQERWRATEKTLKLKPRYITNCHYKMIAVGDYVLVGGMNLDASTSNMDAMFLLDNSELGRGAIKRFNYIWENGNEWRRPITLRRAS